MAVGLWNIFSIADKGLLGSFVISFISSIEGDVDPAGIVVDLGIVDVGSEGMEHFANFFVVFFFAWYELLF